MQTFCTFVKFLLIKLVSMQVQGIFIKKHFFLIIFMIIFILNKYIMNRYLIAEKFKCLRTDFVENITINLKSRFLS